MISCVIDNIIFSLQRSGGISILWKNLIKRMARDKRLYVRFLEYDDATNNVIRETFAINPKNYVDLLSSKGLMLKRYINFCNSQIGKVFPVLFEKETSAEYHQGYTPNYTYVKVKADGNESWRRKIFNVEITGYDGEFCIGKRQGAASGS